MEKEYVEYTESVRIRTDISVNVYAILLDYLGYVWSRNFTDILVSVSMVTDMLTYFMFYVTRCGIKLQHCELLIRVIQLVGTKVISIKITKDLHYIDYRHSRKPCQLYTTTTLSSMCHNKGCSTSHKKNMFTALVFP